MPCKAEFALSFRAPSPPLLSGPQAHGALFLVRRAQEPRRSLRWMPDPRERTRLRAPLKMRLGEEKNRKEEYWSSQCPPGSFSAPFP